MNAPATLARTDLHLRRGEGPMTLRPWPLEVAIRCRACGRTATHRLTGLG